MKVRVDELQAGDVLVLPSGRRVTVEGVDDYDGDFVVRWWRPAERGEPGYKPRVGSRGLGGGLDGRYLGALRGLQSDSLVERFERCR